MRVTWGFGFAATLLASAALAQDHAVHWTYGGEDGPDHWGELSADWSVCGSGQQQSPINLDSAHAVGAELGDIAVAYAPSAATVVNNGHTIQVNEPPGGTLTLDGKTYALRQFHYHAPSEHTIDGKAYPLELHLVHAAEDGALA